MANYEQIHQISGAVHNEEQFEDIISAIKECKYYAYIIHDKDIDDLGNAVPSHLHFVCDDRHSMSRWSKLLGIPEHMIEKVRNFRSMNRYLIHIDDPDKHQYDIRNVNTNLPIRYQSYLEDNQEVNPTILYHDLVKLRNSRITIGDFLTKYQYFISKQSFLSQYRILTDLVNNYSITKENIKNER